MNFSLLLLARVARFALNARFIRQMERYLWESAGADETIADSESLRKGLLGWICGVQASLKRFQDFA
jgi:hypothetical protein